MTNAPVDAAALGIAAALLETNLGSEAADAFLAREAARCPTCDDYGLVTDHTHPFARDGFPSLAPEIPCPTCNREGNR